MKPRRHAVAVFSGAALLVASLIGVVAPNATAASSVPTAHRTQNEGSMKASATVTTQLKAALQNQRLTHRSAGGRHICYAAHVQNNGWQAPVCDGAVAGTTGQGLRVEALSIVVSGVGGLCANAHLQNLGWQGWNCREDGVQLFVGTTGQALRMEGLDLTAGTGTICAEAHVERIGWQGRRCVPSPLIVSVGTSGQALRMEAITLTV